ncbi:MAG TPA: aminopeptidase P family protein [Verrucomicrobium sp.]|nr:aminopeptidase P family protein [Verrucomicrobium sp.]
MRYRPLPAAVFAAARKRLARLLPPGAVAILHANDVYPTNADGTMGFVQNSDLFYLSGVDQEETILVLFPDAPDEKMREMLFLRETSETIAVWEGDRLTKAQATERSGVPASSIHWDDQFERYFRTAMCQARQVFLNSNEALRARVEVETRERRFVARCQREFPLHRYERLAPFMHELRVVKAPGEIDAIKQAIDITDGAFRRVLDFVKPGVMEYEVEAEIIHEFIRRGAQGHAYTPIIASGKNACVLHYIQNEAPCGNGDLLLMDFGARHGNYNADLTRTIPVNGRYTPRQRAVYDAVLRVHRHARKLLKPGVLIGEYQQQVGDVVEQELVKLKLLTKSEAKAARVKNPDSPAYKKYFMHGTSHLLGLDVHDVGDTTRKIKAGMVFTIEPGIYIREEGIGVRIENNVVITAKGNNDLMANIPIEAEEIEAMMERRLKKRD